MPSLKHFLLIIRDLIEDRVYWDDEAVQKRYVTFLGAKVVNEYRLKEMARFRENSLYMFTFEIPPENTKLISLLRNGYLPLQDCGGYHRSRYRLNALPSRFLKVYDYFLSRIGCILRYALLRLCGPLFAQRRCESQYCQRHNFISLPSYLRVGHP